MDFKESDLVNLFIEQNHDLEFLNIKNNRSSNFIFTKEFCLENGQRIDILAKHKRLYWLLEFKKEADINALWQVLEYRERLKKLIIEQKESKFYILRTSIAANYFHESLIEKANLFGVDLVHVGLAAKDCCFVSNMDEYSYIRENLTTGFKSKRKDWYEIMFKRSKWLE
jgi:hypothetical protein